MADWKFTFEEIADKIKSQFHAKGYDNLTNVYAMFMVRATLFLNVLTIFQQDFDKDNTQTLNKIEFEKFLAKVGIFPTKQVPNHAS